MADVNPTLPVVAELNATADPKTLTALSTLISTVNNLDEANIAPGAFSAEVLSAAVAAQLGLSQAATVRRAYAEILGISTCVLGTALGDGTVAGPSCTVTVPANGLVCAMAYVEAKGSDTAYCGLSEDAAAVAVSAAILSVSVSGSFVGAYPAASGLGTPVKTRATMIGPFPASAGAHTYKLVYGSGAATSMQWQNRKLWVWTLGP